MSKINIEEAFREKRKANPMLTPARLSTQILRAYKRELRNHGVDPAGDAYAEGVAALEIALEKTLLARFPAFFALTGDTAWRIRMMSAGSGHSFEETVDILLTAILEIARTETVRE